MNVINKIGLVWFILCYGLFLLSAVKGTASPLIAFLYGTQILIGIALFVTGKDK